MARWAVVVTRVMPYDHARLASGWRSCLSRAGVVPAGSRYQISTRVGSHGLPPGRGLLGAQKVEQRGDGRARALPGVVQNPRVGPSSRSVMALQSEEKTPFRVVPGALRSEIPWVRCRSRASRKPFGAVPHRRLSTGLVSSSNFAATSTDSDDTAASTAQVPAWALVIAWSAEEPHRAGEVAFLPPSPGGGSGRARERECVCRLSQGDTQVSHRPRPCR
jgi:hypothetical protein